MNIIAIIFTNVWEDPPKLEVRKTDIPFIYFRVVTRGLYQNLVADSLRRNIETCQKIGLNKFKFDVVTDIPLNLKASLFVREIVVPKEYVSKNNSLYKARALQYCLEEDIDRLLDDDWIVHLDEETILTEGSVIGLANFATKNLGSLGQGVITYGNDRIVNWYTTIADSIRVSIDIGLMKFCFQKLHRPVYGFKGSFIIVKAPVEKALGFDFGPNGSIAEDLFFALEAWKRGYKFNFVEGEMWEKSPFTIADYIRQRKRWFVGRMLGSLSPTIPIKCKLLIFPTDINWLLLSLNLLNIPISIFVPVKTPQFLIFVNAIIGGVIVFLYTFGSIKSFSIRRYGLIRKLMICICTIITIPFTACLDGIAASCGFFGQLKHEFYIVQKENTLFQKSVV
ncbi:hypothetical protein CHS0354_007099 [Potamilus streckersoni]|uniref:Glycosyltransferase 2-like domain-containing protein n=1 Tax=Potamilus streckersoni TaxID=2493646 RepID=A0AAE0WAK7_9BIVA|nr:hypothetical protein CHS0354_007099 [Potamilus streckersoni]